MVWPTSATACPASSPAVSSSAWPWREPLALEPRILLLDEPFSALDTKLRVELRTFVRNLQREVGTTTILVTHDQEEALELSDRIVVLDDGHIEQIGDPTEIYDTPATMFVADFLGAMNFFAGAHTAHEVRLPGGVMVHVEQDASGLNRGTTIGVRPEDVVISGDAALPGRFAVESVTSKGHYKELQLRVGDTPGARVRGERARSRAG